MSNIEAWFYKEVVERKRRGKGGGWGGLGGGGGVKGRGNGREGSERKEGNIRLFSFSFLSATTLAPSLSTKFPPVSVVTY